MTHFTPKVQRVSCLVAGISGAFCLAYFLQRRGELSPFHFTVGVFFPFLLALLTGVAKTTTV